MIDLAGRRILVTGGAGFIGSAVIRMLTASNCAKIINVDKLTYAGNLESLAAASADHRYVFERLDIADSASVRRVFHEHQPDAVLHLAAESHVDRSIEAPADFIATNVVGTFALLTEAQRHCEQSSDIRERFRFVHVSTDEVFGSLGAAGMFTADTSYDPSSPYSATKAASDHLARAWHRTYGLAVIVTNCSNNYGPCQFPEKLIPLMILKGMGGEPLPVYGRGENVRDWLYVYDHAAALLMILARGIIGRTYLVGGSSERRNIDVVLTICRLLDELRPAARKREEQIRFVADRPGHDLRYAIDPAAIEAELGWQPTETFESGLRKTVIWYLEHESWWRRVLSGAYQGERLGLYAV